MYALTIAIIALAVAGYAFFVSARNQAAVNEWIDAQAEEDDEPESAELWISAGDLHTPDVKALYAATGALAIYMEEFVPMAVIEGKGTMSLHKLLSEGSKPEASKVRPIKP